GGRGGRGRGGGRGARPPPAAARAAALGRARRPLPFAVAGARAAAQSDCGRNRQALHGRAHGGRDRRAPAGGLPGRAGGGHRRRGGGVSRAHRRARTDRGRGMTPAGPRPFTLIAELTYRCPLRCPYCSNPGDLERHAAELETALWQRVLGEAAELGVVQVHFTGGEPLVRDDLEELVRAARALDLYTNLITSGLPLERARLDELAKAGLDHVQLSIQDVSAEASDRMAGVRSWDAKLKVAEWVKAAGRALTINVVLQRENLDRVEQV